MILLPNGLKVLYRQDVSFPLAVATLLFGSGARQENRHEEGLSSMSIDLLMQGTRNRNAESIARVMEAVGASMGTQGHEDYSEMGFIVPSRELDRALGVMTDVLSEPAFPQAEIVKEKSHVLASLESRKDEIFNVAYDALNRSLYGAHPYGRPLEGNKEAVQKFVRKDFQNWHRGQLTPEGAVLSMIGPSPSRSVEQLLKRTLAKWSFSRSKAPQALTRTVPKPVDTLLHRETVVVRSAFQQAYLMIGYRAPHAKHVDQVPLKVLNTLLGGGMSSRLFIELREKLGLAYEVSSFYPSRLDTSQWVLYLGLPAEKLQTAARKLDEILEQLARRGPTSDEVKQAKAMIRGAFLMDRQSRRRQAWYNAWWEYMDRGPRYGEEFLQEIDAVTVATLQSLMQRLLSQPRVVVKVIPK